MAVKTKLIFNMTRGEALCVGEMADSPLPRMRGLIGRHGLPAGEGLLLKPAPSIHTAFMRFPIDALFLDRTLQVVDIVERLRPWRVASSRRARAVLELPAGESSRRGVKIGDRLVLKDRRLYIPPEAPSGAVEAPEPSRSIIWPDRAANGDGSVAQQIRVVVVSRDRHFRSATSMLLAHRGCAITTTANPSRAEELARREDATVVVVDAEDACGDGESAVSAVARLVPRVGVVVVGESALPHPQGLPVVEKWGPFDDLFSAIEAAAGRHDRNR